MKMADFLGWQMQKGDFSKTIEGCLLRAIFLATKQNVKLNCAGRTDSGVRALAQIADFWLEGGEKFEIERLFLALNHHLKQICGQKIAILQIEEVSDDFHSRYSCAFRSYIYKIINRRAPLTLQQNRACFEPIPLDFEKMQMAAQFFVGTHDFSSFQDSNCQAFRTIKTVEKLELSKIGDEICLEIKADSFLHHMVRNIAGCLILVGRGKIEPQEIPQILKSKNRQNSGFNAPACGLYFLQAHYE